MKDNEKHLKTTVTFRLTEDNIAGIAEFQEKKSKELGFSISKNQAINILLASGIESQKK
jgi:hypothetical protein